jgi:hypothetical protein
VVLIRLTLGPRFSAKVILHWYYIHKRAFYPHAGYNSGKHDHRRQAPVFAVGFEVALYYSFHAEPAGER